MRILFYVLAAICDQFQKSSNSILNMKLFFAFLIATTIFSCNGKKASDKNSENQLNYELVNTWPELNKGYKLSQPTGIGIDKDDHIFVFHRTGRKWTTPFPDSVRSYTAIALQFLGKN